MWRVLISCVHPSKSRSMFSVLIKSPAEYICSQQDRYLTVAMADTGAKLHISPISIDMALERFGTLLVDPEFIYSYDAAYQLLVHYPTQPSDEYASLHRQCPTPSTWLETQTNATSSTTSTPSHNSKIWPQNHKLRCRALLRDLHLVYLLRVPLHSRPQLKNIENR